MTDLSTIDLNILKSYLLIKEAAELTKISPMSLDDIRKEIFESYLDYWESYVEEPDPSKCHIKTEFELLAWHRCSLIEDEKVYDNYFELLGDCLTYISPEA